MSNPFDSARLSAAGARVYHALVSTKEFPPSWEELPDVNPDLHERCSRVAVNMVLAAARVSDVSDLSKDPIALEAAARSYCASFTLSSLREFDEFDESSREYLKQFAADVLSAEAS